VSGEKKSTDYIATQHADCTCTTSHASSDSTIRQEKKEKHIYKYLKKNILQVFYLPVN